MSNPVVLFFKSRVDPYVRGNRIVRGYTNRKVVNSRKDAGPSQLTLVFPKAGDFQTVPPVTPAPGPEVKKFYVTVIRNPGPNQKVGFLAGPFDTHEEALAKKSEASMAARNIDPTTDFDYFGTSGLTLPSGSHPPGKLNAHLGISAAS